MMASLMSVEGIGKVYTAKLADAGLKTTDALLAAGTTPKERAALAEKTGIDPDLILRWVNLVDLFRIRGIGEEYSDLLEAAGVDTVPELARRNPANLYAKMVEVNQEERKVRRLPTEAQVADWIDQAKKLDRKINY
jgi:predicted flap endonuclease-1-like 5' DNA nuclease